MNLLMAVGLIVGVSVSFLLLPFLICWIVDRFIIRRKYSHDKHY